MVGWTEPVFEDNCGDSSTCLLSITHYYGGKNPVKVYVGVNTTITYTAVDPSLNKNENCSFVIRVKGKYLPPGVNCKSEIR